MSKETKRERHGRQELVAIFRLEFYRKQTRWKLAHASARKAAPAARKSRVLNQTYIIDAGGHKHATQADSKTVTSSEENKNSTNYRLIPPEAFDTPTVAENNELNKRQVNFSQDNVSDTYEENRSNECVNEEQDQEGKPKVNNENIAPDKYQKIAPDTYQKENRLKSLNDAIALHIHEQEERQKHNVMRNSNIPAQYKHENPEIVEIWRLLEQSNINNQNNRPTQNLSENVVSDIYEEHNDHKPINEGISSNMFQKEGRNHKVLLRNLNIAAEKLQHENLLQLFGQETVDADFSDQNNNRPKQNLTENAFTELLEYIPKSHINEATLYDFYQQQKGSHYNINLLNNFNIDAASVKNEERNNYFNSIRDLNVAKEAQFQQETRPSSCNDKVTVIDIEEEENMPIIDFNVQRNSDLIIPGRYQQNTPKSYINEDVVTGKNEENNNLKNYLNSIENLNVANIMTYKNENENRQTYFTKTPADLNLVPDRYKKEVNINTYVNEAIVSDIYKQENIPKSDFNLQENLNLMTPDKYQQINNPKNQLNEVDENKLKNYLNAIRTSNETDYLDTIRNSNKIDRLEIQNIPKCYMNGNATPDIYKQSKNTFKDLNAAKSDGNEENILKNYLNMIRDSNMSLSTAEQENKPELFINQVMDLNMVSNRNQQDIRSNRSQIQNYPQEELWQMYSKLETRPVLQRGGPRAFPNGLIYFMDTHVSVPPGFEPADVATPARPPPTPAHGRRCEHSDCADERADCTDDVQMQVSERWSMEPEGSWEGDVSWGAREFAAGASLRPHSSELQLHPAPTQHPICTCGDPGGADGVTHLAGSHLLTSMSSECHYLASRRCSPPTRDCDHIVAGSHLNHPQRALEGGDDGIVGRGRGRLRTVEGGTGRGRLCR